MPERILFGYCFVFYFTSPFFNQFFTFDGLFNRAMHFVIDEQRNVMFLGEPIDKAVLMFPNAPDEIVRNADIKRTVKR